MRCFVFLPAGGIFSRLAFAGAGVLGASGPFPAVAPAVIPLPVGLSAGSFGRTGSHRGASPKNLEFASGTAQGSRKQREAARGRGGGKNPGVSIPEAAPKQAALMRAIKPPS